MPDVLVVNASPLIFLGNAGRLDLLHATGASRIIVPQARRIAVVISRTRGECFSISERRGCGCQIRSLKTRCD